MRKSNKIRLGMVRCDTHTYWYAPFLAKCDAKLLEANDHPVHHYFSSIFSAEQLHIPRVSGFELVNVWDADQDKAERFSQTFMGKPKVCNTLEQVSDGVDAVFIPDCSGDGHDHVELASLFLKKGIPTYVDKPFAPNLADAQTLVKLAKKHRTCVMSASLLEFNPVAKQFQKRFGEIDPVRLLVAKGVGGYGLAGVIHGIGLARCLLGDGVEWVQAMGHTPLDPGATKELNQSDFTQWSKGKDKSKGQVPLTYLRMHYKNGCEALVINTDTDIFPDICSFFASAYSKQGAIHSPAIGDPEFLGGGEVILKMFRKMVRTNKPVIPYDSLLEKIAIVDAGRLSQRKGKPVYLKEIL